MAFAEYANKEHYAHDAPNVLAWKILAWLRNCLCAANARVDGWPGRRAGRGRGE